MPELPGKEATLRRCSMLKNLFWGAIIISLITTEGVLLQGDYKYISSDELQIIEYLDNESTTGIIFVPTPVIGRRLEAYGFKAVLSFNRDAALYFGWIEPSMIIANSSISIIHLVLSGRLFVYDGPDYERVIWNQLYSFDLTSTINRELAIELGFAKAWYLTFLVGQLDRWEETGKLTEDGRFYVSRRYVRGRIGLSFDRQRRFNKDLEARNLINYIKRQAENGQWYNYYFININNIKELIDGVVAKPLPPVVAKSLPPVAAKYSHIRR